MMAALILLFAGLLASLAIARRCAILCHFADLARLSRRSASILGRRGVSDWSKERATRIMAVRMLAKSLTALALLLLVAAPVLAVLALDPLADAGTIAAFADPTSRLTLFAMGVCLAGFRFARRLRLWPA